MGEKFWEGLKENGVSDDKINQLEELYCTSAVREFSVNGNQMIVKSWRGNGESQEDKFDLSKTPLEMPFY